MKGIAKVIPIRGFILSRGSFPMGQIPGEVTYSDEIVRHIKKLEKDEKTKGIIFEINSQGGTPYSSREIGEAIKKIEKPIVALIKEYGTSGAYWIASTCNKIVADVLSYIGSVGVKVTAVDVSKLYKRSGIRLVETFTIGKYKDIAKEKALLEKLSKIVYQYFVEEIKKNRKIKDKKVLKNVMSSRPFLGQEAKELGLIDELGNLDKAVEIAGELAGEQLEIEYIEEKPSPMEMFGKMLSLKNLRRVEDGI